jgi:general secretion pathway protein C
MNRILALNLLLALLCFIVLAKITADLFAYRLAHTFPKTASKAAPAPRQAAAEDLMSFAPLLEKGLFGAATQGKLTHLQQSAAATGAQSTSRGDLLLLGTAVGSFRETFALIQKASTREERVFRLGDRVYDLGSLVLVRKEVAEIQAGGERIRLMTPTATGADSGRQNPANPATQPNQLATSGRGAAWITALTPLDNIGQAMTDARPFQLQEGNRSGIGGQAGRQPGVVGSERRCASHQRDRSTSTSSVLCLAEGSKPHKTGSDKGRPAGYAQLRHKISQVKVKVKVKKSSERHQDGWKMVKVKCPN